MGSALPAAGMTQLSPDITICRSLTWPFHCDDGIQILALLGTADKHASEGMYEVLHECMKRADVGINVGYAFTVMIGSLSGTALNACCSTATLSCTSA